MAEPSSYELSAWRDIQQFEGRPMSQAMRNVGERVMAASTDAREHAENYLDDRPRAKEALARGKDVVARGAKAVGGGVSSAVEALPDGVTSWSNAAFGSMRQTVGRVSRIGLSPARVVARHKKHGHDVEKLVDLRRLGLEEIDVVRGRGTDWFYPLLGAASGATAGLMISGGQIAVPVSAGVATAPSAGVVAGAFIGDAAVVLGLASRAVGHVSLLYGYDPEEPAEKIFVMSVVNAGTALSASAKTAAMMDLSRLTQALVRGKTWAVLNKSVVAQASTRFANAFTGRLTKQALGKVVPVAGIAVGGAFNWASLESIVDAADVAYRRRFLLEKYPDLQDDVPELVDEGARDDLDDAISVLDVLAEVGGPDLRESP